MKRLSVVCLAFVMTVAFGFTNAYAQLSSAKGSAAISGLKVVENGVESIENLIGYEQEEEWTDILFTYIKIASQKELIFDVALQCGLFTDTHVKSKGGNQESAEATAAINVRVKLERFSGTYDQDGEPVFEKAFYAHPSSDAYGDGVTFCKRKQYLMAVFQGTFDITPEGTIDISTLDYEEVQLILETLSANAFNFVSPNLVSGEYRVSVEAKVTTTTTATGDSTAVAKGLVGLGSMVVDEVRFIKGDLGIQ